MTKLIDRLLKLSPDPMVEKLFLCDSPLPVLTLIGLYVLFVKKWGPNIMKSRRPYELKGLLIAYNSFQVVININIVLNALSIYYHYGSWINYCFEIETDDPRIINRVILITYTYVLVKILDMLDTVFFVLRKRYDQVTFLHFYHHILMCIGIWLAFRYWPNGHGNMLGFVNAIVHSVMYFYYLLASAHLIDNNIWWKKYITLMQITQFVFLFVFMSYPLLNGTNCGYKMKVLQFCVAQTLVMLVLFINFYIRAYVIKKKIKTQ